MQSLPAWFMAFTFTFAACGGGSDETENTNTEETSQRDDVTDVVEEVTASGANLIKLALLLDTSNSMDGLIEQAKSQLWKIVNALSEAQKNGEFAELQISLYEYGNDDLKRDEGYVRQVLPLTTDLDDVSHELFQLNTYGGDEYCGEVIAQSLSDLSWDDTISGGLQVIVIAGNEPFTQGETNYKSSCERAVDSDIIVNTIYCGDSEEGIATNWRDGAEISNGFYGNIEMDEATIYIDTPYDDEINALNSKLNKTYIAYGRLGNSKMQMQAEEDANSGYYGSANTTERTIAKGKKHLYKNQTWDLVDASDEEDFDIDKIEDKDLPTELKGKSKSEKLNYIEKKKNEREKIQDKIGELAKKRADYIEDEKARMNDGETNHLEDAIIEAIKKQAIAKGFTFEGEQIAQR